MADQLDAEAFGRALYDEISRRGLGNIPKREMDILLLHLLEVHGGLSTLSNGELSTRFRTTETKIRGLRHEASLRFSEDLEEEYRRRLNRLIESASLHVKRDRVVCVVEDRFLRSMLLSDLKATGAYADWSFNSELLQIDPEALASVIVERLPESDLAGLRTELGLSTVGEVKGVLRGALTRTVEAIKKKATDDVVELGLDWVKAAAKDLPKQAGKVLLLLLL